jgi:signal peptidase I
MPADDANKEVAETQNDAEVVKTGTGAEIQAGEAPAVRTEEKQQAAKTGARDEDDESLLKEWVGLLVRAGCWALLIYLFIFQVSVVDGPSMQATFEPGDRLVIDKLSYRFSSVQRFDVIVFEAIDREKSPRMSRDYIKRVIGLPGERIEIHGGHVWVKAPADKEFKRLDEPVAYGSTEAALPIEGQSFTVPPGHYFVMGDNRGASKDSRINRGSRESLGFVAYSQIKGLGRTRIWPWARRRWFGRGEEHTAQDSK